MSEQRPEYDVDVSEIRTDNDFFIGTNGTELAAMLPVQIRSREQAFRTAAYIALMGETLPAEEPSAPRVSFEDVQRAVMNT